jgi:DNA-binding CsgD family transcriptional regulator
MSLLTADELSILNDAANGLSARESAVFQRESIERVRESRTLILIKLNARNMAHAVGIASASGMLAQERETSTAVCIGTP